MSADKHHSRSVTATKWLQHIRRWVASIAKGLVLTLVLLLLTLLSLSASETGTRWLLQTAFSSIKQLNVAEIDGTLLNQLSLKQLKYQESEDFFVEVAEFRLQWYAAELLQGHLHVALLQLDGITIKGQPAGTEETEGSGIPKIPLTVSVDSLLVNRLEWLEGKKSTKIHKFALHAKLMRNELTLSRLVLTMPELQVNARSVVQLQSDWPLTADLTWSYTQDKQMLKGQLAISGNLDQFDLKSVIKGPVQSEQTGFIRLSGEQPEFNLNGNWQKLQWPLTGEAQISSKRGELQIQGNTQNYLARLKADAQATAMNKTKTGFSIDFTGNGNEAGIAIKELRLKPAQGELNLSGQLSWAQTFAFDLAIAAKQFNPADLGAEIPGKLNLKAQSKGSIANGKINAGLNIAQLTGSIQGQPVNAHGQIKFFNEQLDIQQLQIAAGNNKLRAKGHLSKRQADLDLSIDAPDLRTAWPNLAGSIKGDALIKGSLQKPVVKSNLQGRNLRYADNRIGSLSLDADYVHASKQSSKLDFSARNLQLAEHKIESIDLKSHGNQANHNAVLEMRSTLSNLNIKLDGQWTDKQWQGQIKQLIIEHPQLQQWQLQSPTTISLSQTKDSLKIELPYSCLTQDDANLCISAKGSPDQQLNAELQLSAWPLADIKPWLPDELSLTGKLSAQAKLSSINNEWIAQMDANIAEGRALLMGEDNVNLELALSASELKAQYQHDRLTAQLELGLGKQDYIKAQVTASETNPAGVRQLSGSMSANVADMSLIDGLLPEIKQLQGLLVADLQIDGNTAEPALTGSAHWQNGQLQIPRLGSTFRNINLQVNSARNNPERLLLIADLESGQGKLSGKGHLDLQQEHNYPLQFSLQGENFQVSKLPEAVVVISPTLNIDKQDNLTKIDGLIKIDNAKVEMKTLPETAIAPSDDEVIISADQPKPKKMDVSRLNTNINIDFGDKAHFSGFGLKTRLAGQLKYTVKQDKPSMQGRAFMKDATYRSYGQDLSIRKGEFLFNGPADNPWLNIEAIRKATSDEVTAVLNVTGPLKSPQTRVYTEPALPESEAFAYLVTGNSLKNASQSDGSAIAGAAFNYGAGQLSWLSDQLGIDEFEFEQGDKIEDSAVRLGQYLNPDLYVGVSMGLFASSYAANFRYRLSDHFSIRTHAGDTQRIELKYHLQTE